MNIIQTYIKSYLEHAGNFCISQLGKLSFKQFSPPPPLRLIGLKRAHARRPQLVAVVAMVTLPYTATGLEAAV